MQFYFMAVLLQHNNVVDPLDMERQYRHPEQVHSESTKFTERAPEPVVAHFEALSLDWQRHDGTEVVTEEWLYASKAHVHGDAAELVRS